MRNKLFFVIVINCLSSFVWSQDTAIFTFNSAFHLKHDYRDYNYELEHCVVFIPNRYHSVLNDGVYIFKDSISETVRLKGAVTNGVKNGKWSYFDSLGNLRIEDIFLNDYNGTLITNYYQTDGNLYRIKESSSKYLSTTHFDSTGVSSYYFMDYMDSNNVQMSFDNLGQINYQSSLKKGRKHGVFYWTYDDGSLYSRHTYIEGKKEGVWKSRLIEEEGIWCEQEFVNDKLISIKFNSGKEYIIDTDTVEVIDYYASGEIRLKGIVIEGYKSGTWEYHDIQGGIIARFNHDELGNVTTMSGKLEGIPGI